MQGEVPLKDRQDGRSQLGYRCNLILVGQHQGQGAGWQNAWYGHCDYYDTKTSVDPTKFPNGGGNGQINPGTQVVDVSNPAHPELTGNLDTPALDGPWESLKVNQPRGLLAGVGGFGGDVAGPLYFDVYDVKTDCAHPKLLASVPFDTPNGHEGNWAPDGMTYYGTNLAGGLSAAIDVSNPASPAPITVGQPGGCAVNHGLSLSDDGKTLYVACISPEGLKIVDTSAIQDRAAGATFGSTIGSLSWSDGSTGQVPIPISYGTHPYILFVDEGGGTCCGGVSGVPAGAARIIDIANPAAPKIISVLRLAIQTPKYAKQNQAEIAGNGSFGYQAHYCAVDREHNPTAAACGYFQSGIRVFDIRNPYQPHEIAYFNPPAQVAKHGQLPGSEHDGGPNNSQPPNMTADWCSSQIRFYTAADGSHELWAQCQDNGFMVLKFTNAVYPLPELPAQAPTFTVAPKAPARTAVLGVKFTSTQSGPLPRTGGSPLLAVCALLATVVGAGLLRRARSKP
ncbi:MAG TPA: hypothetical protein VNG13_13375 [Mycobacteriales bacterium]|nr:hypothetical protein [Mycobacteriales bacterium]